MASFAASVFLGPPQRTAANTIMASRADALFGTIFVDGMVATYRFLEQLQWL
ncbi:hypothetical protein HPP92_013074 [Vanilla planifolia]|uniref:Uncharacterized protein n=1 Tax=Vanilla planifolia TaxID=51239 RepID=A0A835QRM6_VANPL|nr:hypothetical protein HPP92_013074 [Vanilla planifolia]